MERVRAGRVIVSRQALAEPLTARRIERVVAALDAPRAEVLDESLIDALQRATPWESLPRRGRHQADFQQRVIFLDRMRWDREDTVFPGYKWAEERNSRFEWARSGVVCQTAVEIQSILGCGYDCSYCPYTAAATLTCDLERFVDHLEQLWIDRPAQQLYKLNNRSDTLIFEPEYGLCELLVPRFARTSDKVLMLYAKSANVRHLQGLDHEEHTVACFTLTMPQTARALEPSAPPFERRLEAAAQCAKWGYPVRFRLSPIVPYKGWRQEMQAGIARMAAVVEPELVTLWTLSMVEYDELSRVVDPDALDPDFVDDARASREVMAGAKGAPFSDGKRAEIYEAVADALARYSPRTRLSLCLEVPAVLERLSPRLAIIDGAQICNCGPRCTPAAVAGAPGCGDPSARGELSLQKTDPAREPDLRRR